jgi:antitoxin HicB
MRDAEDLMKGNYRVVLQYDSDGYWIAEHPELPGCKADGETAQEALTSLDTSRKLWIESSLANGLEVPEPQEAPQYSGRFVLRIPKSLHRELANEAEAECVSLNSLISNFLSSRHTRRTQPASSSQPFLYQNIGAEAPNYTVTDLGKFYSGFCPPERVNMPAPNVRVISGRGRTDWSSQVWTSENEQTPEKERQYA